MDKITETLKKSIDALMVLQRKLYKFYIIALGISVAKNTVEKVRESKKKYAGKKDSIKDHLKRTNRER